MLNVAVVGVGTMGRRHAENLATLVPGAQLAAVCDVDGDRVREVARHCSDLSARSVASFTDELTLLDLDGLDAILLAGPAGLHRAQIERAAAAGKHIFCEKPLALTLEDAQAAVTAADRAGVALQIGFMRRYDPAYAAAKRAIERGDIGAPVMYKAMARDPRVPPASFLRSPLTAGIFVDSAIHDFDAGRWLMSSEVVEVSAFGAALISPDLRQAGEYDTIVANLRFESGALGNQEGYWNATYGYDIRAEVIGERGTVQIGRLGETATTMLLEGGARYDVFQDFLARFQDAYVLELRDFVSRVTAGIAPAVTGDDGVRALAVSLAAEQSAKAGGDVVRVASA